MQSLSLRGYGAMRRPLLLLLVLALMLVGMPEALAHGVPEGDKGFIQESTGVLFVPFMYMGAKHMITGYDHLLFLFGVIFFLYRLKDVGLYVTLFAVGHSITLLFGVLMARRLWPLTFGWKRASSGTKVPLAMRKTTLPSRVQSTSPRSIGPPRVSRSLRSEHEKQNSIKSVPSP